MCTGKYTRFAFLISITIIFIGCSGSTGEPITPDNPTEPAAIFSEKETDSNRMLLGIWDLRFDPIKMEVSVTPVRNSEIHVDVTDFLLPPNCDDCVAIAVNSFDPVTRILDADVTLRNPTPLNGYDVRGILFTNVFGHLLTNADDWTALWDAPGGMNINPFMAFAKDKSNRLFTGGTQETENYLVYIPQPPSYYAIRYAVDASWPGNCKEPWTIIHWAQHNHFYDYAGAWALFEVAVHDWQYDVSAVSVVAPDITGEAEAPLVHKSGEWWTLDFYNTMACEPGEYSLQILATSADSGNLALHDFVVVLIEETPPPTFQEIDPESGLLGEVLTDVEIIGSKFLPPTCLVKLKMEGEPDIEAENVAIVDNLNLTCDIDIPLNAALGLYDIEITHGGMLSCVGEDAFEISALIPEVTGIDPNSALLCDELTGVSVIGSNFQGPGAQVKLKLDGEPDIVADNVNVNTSLLITCDISIPLSATIGLYDVEVTNSTELSATGVELFEVIELIPDDPVDVTPGGLNFSPVDLCFVGDYAYIASRENGLNIFDVTDRLDPQWLGKTDDPGFYHSVDVVDDLAYVAEWDGLYVYDISIPGSPSLVTFVSTTGSTMDSAVGDGYVFITCSYTGLDIIDIDPIESAYIVETVDLGGGVSVAHVTYDNGYVYISCSLDGLNIVDVDPPASASIVANIPLQNDPPLGMAVTAIHGGYAYTCEYGKGLHIIDIEPPEFAWIVNTVTGYEWMSSVAVKDDGYAYVGADYEGFLIVDVDPPLSANVVHKVTTPNYDVCGLTLYDSIAYLIEYASVVHFIDISDPLTASIADSMYTPAYAMDVDVESGYAYISCGPVNLIVVDVEPPESSCLLSLIDKYEGYSEYLDVYGDYVYLSDAEEGMLIVDVSFPEMPSILTEIDLEPAPRGGLEYSDGYVYATTKQPGIYTIDVDPPESAHSIGYLSGGAGKNDVSVVGDYAYVAGSFAGLYIIDISTPGSEEMINTIDTVEDATRVDAGGGYACVLAGDLVIIDVDPPETAEIVKTVELPEDGSEVMMYGGYAYVACNMSGLQIVDINPPESAFILTSIAPISQSKSVVVKGDYAYVGDLLGFQIIQLW